MSAVALRVPAPAGPSPADTGRPQADGRQAFGAPQSRVEM